MPLALLAAMPPIIAASIDAGSGPILRPKRREPPIGGRADHARLQRDGLAARADGSQRRQLSPSNTSTESLIAWPDRLVPAARNVTGVCKAAQSASRRTTSSSLSTTTAIWGTSR